jgi:hypothetical protein
MSCAAAGEVTVTGPAIAAIPNTATIATAIKNNFMFISLLIVTTIYKIS